MTQHITATVENGLLRPAVPLNLANGTQVEVTIDLPQPTGQTEAAAKTPAEILAEIAAMPIESPDPDPYTSRDHDHYLYGAPRRS